MKVRTCDDTDLEARLAQMTKDFFLSINGHSYGRCDFRVDQQGRPYLLEINANCAVFLPPGLEGMDDCILKNSPGGHAYFIDLILAAAIKHHRQRK